ncbi:MAG TPA: hypothetical protein VL325_10880 [Pyrinomonadaceae bacterium]|nr:hypothetical protein [Pyrinomonadaceae bacterium]
MKNIISALVIGLFTIGALSVAAQNSTMMKSQDTMMKSQNTMMKKKPMSHHRTRHHKKRHHRRHHTMTHKTM